MVGRVGAAAGPRPRVRWWSRGQDAWPVVAVVVVSILGLPVLQRFAPTGQAGTYILLAGAGLMAVWLGLRNPIIATYYLLFTTFFRLAIPHVTPVDPWILAFGGVIAAVLIWGAQGQRVIARFDVIEAVIGLYILWNLVSMIAPHTYPPGGPYGTPDFSVTRFILIGTVMPLTMFAVGRRVFVTEQAVRKLLWAIVVAGAYSAAVSIMQFTGPEALVWPRFILTNKDWPDRAIGAFGQPVVNGMVLVYGFLAALLLASYAAGSRWTRWIGILVAGACVYSVYLTHTRAVWAALVVVLVVGAIWAKGFRTGFVAALSLIGVFTVVKWSVLTSSDRSAGGVGSVSEVQDRMNTLATSLWAAQQHPIVGWGIGRFPVVNTYHHKQWSPETPWVRGFGIASHFNELGILAELGVVGLGLWLLILGLIGYRLIRGYRLTSGGGMYGQPLVLTAIMVFGVQVTAGLTVDLRYFDFPNLVSFLLVGAVLGRMDRRTWDLREWVSPLSRDQGAGGPANTAGPARRGDR